MNEIANTGKLRTLLEELSKGKSIYVPVLIKLRSLKHPSFDDMTSESTLAGYSTDWAASLNKETLDSDYQMIWKNDFHGGLDRVCTIGRSRQNDFKIENESVSANHALISLNRTRNGYVVKDLGSRNKTLLNGEVVVPHVNTSLWPGVVMAFGEAVYMFAEPSMLREISEVLESAR